MKRYTLIAVLLALCPLAWWVGRAAEREADRLERFAAGVPTKDVVIPLVGSDPQRVTAEMPENPFEMVNGELIPIDEPRKEAHRNTSAYRMTSQWAYGLAWISPLLGLLVLRGLIRKRQRRT